MRVFFFLPNITKFPRLASSSSSSSNAAILLQRALEKRKRPLLALVVRPLPLSSCFIDTQSCLSPSLQRGKGTIHLFWFFLPFLLGEKKSPVAVAHSTALKSLSRQRDNFGSSRRAYYLSICSKKKRQAEIHLIWCSMGTYKLHFFSC